MMTLSALLFAPRWLMITVGIFLVAGQDVYIQARGWFSGDLAPLWTVLQGGGLISTPAVTMLVIYPVLPWIGVLTLGYAAGGLMSGEPHDRRMRFCKIGMCLVVAFVVIRSLDGFGNMRPFMEQAKTGPGWIAFLACEKYPPSLAYLLMTLGPAMLGLALFERCLLYTSPSPRDRTRSRMPSSA